MDRILMSHMNLDFVVLKTVEKEFEKYPNSLAFPDTGIKYTLLGYHGYNYQTSYFLSAFFGRIRNNKTCIQATGRCRTMYPKHASNLPNLHTVLFLHLRFLLYLSSTSFFVYHPLPSPQAQRNQLTLEEAFQNAK
uniref:Uncharacterized protein n=1 Tax=Acrobeloides nanus TaxID=290746 RepID=A0A914DK80_9BILA